MCHPPTAPYARYIRCNRVPPRKGCRVGQHPVAAGSGRVLARPRRECHGRSSLDCGCRGLVVAPGRSCHRSLGCERGTLPTQENLQAEPLNDSYGIRVTWDPSSGVPYYSLRRRQPSVSGAQETYDLRLPVSTGPGHSETKSTLRPATRRVRLQLLHAPRRT